MKATTPSLYDDVYYNSREASAHGLLRPEALFKATKFERRHQDFLEQPQVRWVQAFNTAVLAQDQLRIGQLLDSSDQYLECGEQVQRLIHAIVELGDWKTLARLLFVQTLQAYESTRDVSIQKRKKMKPEDRFVCMFVTDRELVEAARRVVALGLHASNVEIAAQETCYNLLTAARVRSLEEDTNEDFTLRDLREFCEQDDLVALANAWLAFDAQGKLTAEQFCNLKHPNAANTLLELTLLHHSTGCTTFLQALASGRLK